MLVGSDVGSTTLLDLPGFCMLFFSVCYFDWNFPEYAVKVKNHPNVQNYIQQKYVHVFFVHYLIPI